MIMEMKREEIELIVTVRLKTIRWQCSWDWQQARTASAS